MPVLKYAIAGLDAETLANVGQVSGLSGSVWEGYGFGLWGMEKSVFLEMAVGVTEVDKADSFVQRLLVRHGQEAAYRTIDGDDPMLIFADGILRGL